MACRSIILLSLILLFGCNPYQPRSDTHLNILADFDPGTGMLEVNLQMVYLSQEDHSDSMVFHLDEAFSIISLSAQELVRYELSEDERLVLYIQEPVVSGELLHISMSYSGKTGYLFGQDMDYLDIDSLWNWLPLRNDIRKMTYRLIITLPEDFLVENCTGSDKSKNTWILESHVAVSSFNFRILRDVD